MNPSSILDPRGRGALAAVVLVALALWDAPAAHAAQASGAVLLLASKNTGVASGEQIAIDVLVRNHSQADTPQGPSLPAILHGPIAFERLAGDECCGGSGSDLLRFVPGPLAGCEEAGASVVGCSEESDGRILIHLDPQGLLLAGGDERVLLARLRFENGVEPGQTLPRINLRASSSVAALQACVTPPDQQCIVASIEGGTFVKGGTDAIGFCELHVCGDGTTDAREACDDGNLVDGDGCDSSCTPTACGNGTLSDGETCDDGDLIDGDGCDSNCTPTACGNGVVTSGEACDDANDEPGDACDACGIGICPNGRPFTGARFRLANRAATGDGASLRFSGHIDCPDEGCEAIDPLRYGLELRIDAPPGGPLLDLTQRTVVLPSAEAAGCDPNDGWRISSEGRRLIYRNHADALRSANCEAGSARGLRRLQVTLRKKLEDGGAPESEVTEEIGIEIVVRRSSFAALSGAPLRLGIVFSGDPFEALFAPPFCAAASFRAGDCTAGAAGEITCR